MAELNDTDSTWEGLVASHRAVAPVALPDSDSEFPAHNPSAAVLCCSDARVPPSVIFDQPAGELFVARIAGNTATPAVVASLNYAVEHLGVELLIVLGHSGCGAATAAAQGVTDPNLAAIVDPIRPLAERLGDVEVDVLVSENVKQTVADLRQDAGPIGQAAGVGRLEIRGAVHDLRTGQLEVVV